MEKNNQDKAPRKKFVTANKYQEKILVVAMIPVLVVFVAFIGLILLGSPKFMTKVFNIPLQDLSSVTYGFSVIIIWILFIITIFSVMEVFKASHSLVGSFGRIHRELDEIIEGKSKKLITARPGDELAEDLLKRVNVLIQVYLDKKV